MKLLDTEQLGHPRETMAGLEKDKVVVSSNVKVTQQRRERTCSRLPETHGGVGWGREGKVSTEGDHVPSNLHVCEERSHALGGLWLGASRGSGLRGGGY